MRQATMKQAAELYESGWWKRADPEAIVSFQINQDRLCMNFGDFQLAAEKVVGYPVFEVELASPGFVKKIPKTLKLEEIKELVPEIRRVMG